MSNVIIGRGNLQGFGVYAAKDFKKGEIVIQYTLKLLSNKEFEELSENEKMFTHVHHGQIYLYSKPERFVNHSDTPNTYQDVKQQCDMALCNIKKGEMITTDATKDDV